MPQIDTLPARTSRPRSARVTGRAAEIGVMAVVVWGVLAWGDGMASLGVNLVAQTRVPLGIVAAGKNHYKVEQFFSSAVGIHTDWLRAEDVMANGL